MEINNILRLIEELREKMHKLADEKGFTDSEVLNISREIDDLLNKYYEMLKGKTE